MNGFDVFTYEQRYANGKCVLREGNNTILLFETDDAYGKTIVPDDPEMVCRQYMFDAETLALSNEGQFLKDFDILIGVWRRYDSEGNVVEEKDMDEGYPIKWNELKGILLANGIRMDNVQRLSRTKDEQGKPAWLAVIQTNEGGRQVIRIDAVTGDIIE